MSSLILRAAARVLMPLLLIFAFFLLWRGHNDPGGGFVAGLVVAVAFVLRLFSEGAPAARAALLVAPEKLIASGLLIALGSSFLPVLFGRPFLTALWTEIGPSGREILLGTPLLFDIGVCSVVIGVVLTMTFALAED